MAEVHKTTNEREGMSYYEGQVEHAAQGQPDYSTWFCKDKLISLYEVLRYVKAIENPESEYTNRIPSYSSMKSMMCFFF